MSSHLSEELYPVIESLRDRLDVLGLLLGVRRQTQFPNGLGL